MSTDTGTRRENRRGAETLRSATPPRWPSEIERRWQDPGSARAPSTRPTRASRGQPDARGREVLRAGHVPLPLGRGPARRAPAGLHRHRRLRPLPADDRPQRAARDGLRRVRPARRAVRGADRHAPAHHHRGEHRALPARSCAGWAWATTSAARSPPPTSTSTAGPSGSSCRSSTPGTTRSRAGPGRSPSWIAEFAAGSRPTPDGRAVGRAVRGRARRVVDDHRLAYVSRGAGQLVPRPGHGAGQRGGHRRRPQRARATSRCSSAT